MNINFEIFKNIENTNFFKFSKDGQINDLYLILISFLIIILETGILNTFRIFNTLPNLMMIFVIIISIVSNRYKGIKSAIYAGVITDIMIGRGIGIYILYYLVVVNIITSLEDVIFKDNYVTPFILLIFATCLFQIYMLVINYFYLGAVDLSNWFYLKLLPELFYNVVVGVPIYTIAFNKYKGYNMR